MAIRILKVTHYGNTVEENKDVTINPNMIKVVSADAASHLRQDTSVKKVNVLLMDGEDLEIAIGASDLYHLEDIVGGYDNGD